MKKAPELSIGRWKKIVFKLGQGISIGSSTFKVIYIRTDKILIRCLSVKHALSIGITVQFNGLMFEVVGKSQNMFHEEFYVKPSKAGYYFKNKADHFEIGT